MTIFKHKTNQFPEIDFPYFRRLWNNIVVALFAAAFIPLILIGGGMYYYASSALKAKTLDSLRSEVRQHQKTIDQFLSERIMDLREISRPGNLASLTRPGALEAIFKAMQPAAGGGYFTDLGIIDQQGVHRAYVGPYDLITKNYKNAQWFKAVMVSEVYISDVFSGFRQAPHLIIAVKQTENGNPWIIRATIDAVYFDNLVSEIAAGRGDSFLINGNGIFQTSPLRAGQLMGQSSIKTPERFEGIKVEESNGRIQVMVWLESVPWLSVVRMEQSEVFGLFQRVRTFGIFVFILGAVLIGFTVLLTTNHLVRRLETKRRNIHLMGQYLRQANKMTLSLQLYTGFFQEINEALVNVDIASTWIGEQIRKTGGLQEVQGKIDENIEQIKAEILRSRATIHQLTSFSQPADPLIVEININAMLNDLIELFRWELYFNNIRVRLDYQDPLPAIRSDPLQLKQVFQNLMFNALSAVEKDGVIKLTTRRIDDLVQVIVKDDGPGIPEDIIENIFEPLFTTDTKKLGLGLSICRNILEELGGAITVESKSEKGTAFIVELPVRFASSG